MYQCVNPFCVRQMQLPQTAAAFPPLCDSCHFFMQLQAPQINSFVRPLSPMPTNWCAKVSCTEFAILGGRFCLSHLTANTLQPCASCGELILETGVCSCVANLAARSSAVAQAASASSSPPAKRVPVAIAPVVSAPTASPPIEPVTPANLIAKFRAALKSGNLTRVNELYLQTEQMFKNCLEQLDLKEAIDFLCEVLYAKETGHCIVKKAWKAKVALQLYRVNREDKLRLLIAAAHGDQQDIIFPTLWNQMSPLLNLKYSSVETNVQLLTAALHGGRNGIFSQIWPEILTHIDTLSFESKLKLLTAAVTGKYNESVCKPVLEFFINPGPHQIVAWHFMGCDVEIMPIIADEELKKNVRLLCAPDKKVPASSLVQKYRALIPTNRKYVLDIE